MRSTFGITWLLLSACHLSSTQPVMTSTQPVMTSTQPDTTSTQPVMTSTQPVMTSTPPDMTSTQPDTTSTQPDTTSTQPVMTSTQPDTTSTQPVMTSTQLDMTSTQPDTTSTQPDTTSTQPDVSSGQIEITLDQIDMTSGQIDMTSSQTESNMMEGTITEQLDETMMEGTITGQLDETMMEGTITGQLDKTMMEGKVLGQMKDVVPFTKDFTETDPSDDVNMAQMNQANAGNPSMNGMDDTLNGMDDTLNGMSTVQLNVKDDTHVDGIHTAERQTHRDAVIALPVSGMNTVQLIGMNPSIMHGVDIAQMNDEKAMKIIDVMNSLQKDAMDGLRSNGFTEALMNVGVTTNEHGDMSANQQLSMNSTKSADMNSNMDKNNLNQLNQAEASKSEDSLQQQGGQVNNRPVFIQLVYITSPKTTSPVAQAPQMVVPSGEEHSMISSTAAEPTAVPAAQSNIELVTHPSGSQLGESNQQIVGAQSVEAVPILSEQTQDAGAGEREGNGADELENKKIEDAMKQELMKIQELPVMILMNDSSIINESVTEVRPSMHFVSVTMENASVAPTASISPVQTTSDIQNPVTVLFEPAQYEDQFGFDAVREPSWLTGNGSGHATELADPYRRYRVHYTSAKRRPSPSVSVGRPATAFSHRVLFSPTAATPSDVIFTTPASGFFPHRTSSYTTQAPRYYKSATSHKPVMSYERHHSPSFSRQNHGLIGFPSVNSFSENMRTNVGFFGSRSPRRFVRSAEQLDEPRNRSLGRANYSSYLGDQSSRNINGKVVSSQADTPSFKSNLPESTDLKLDIFNEPHSQLKSKIDRTYLTPFHDSLKTSHTDRQAQRGITESQSPDINSDVLHGKDEFYRIHGQPIRQYLPVVSPKSNSEDYPKRKLIKDYRVPQRPWNYLLAAANGIPLHLIESGITSEPHVPRQYPIDSVEYITPEVNGTEHGHSRTEVHASDYHGSRYHPHYEHYEGHHILQPPKEVSNDVQHREVIPHSQEGVAPNSYASVYQSAQVDADTPVYYIKNRAPLQSKGKVQHGVDERNRYSSHHLAMSPINSYHMENVKGNHYNKIHYDMIYNYEPEFHPMVKEQELLHHGHSHHYPEGKLHGHHTVNEEDRLSDEVLTNTDHKLPNLYRSPGVPQQHNLQHHSPYHVINTYRLPLKYGHKLSELNHDLEHASTLSDNYQHNIQPEHKFTEVEHEMYETQNGHQSVDSVDSYTEPGYAPSLSYLAPAAMAHDSEPLGRPFAPGFNTHAVPMSQQTVSSAEFPVKDGVRYPAILLRQVAIAPVDLQHAHLEDVTVTQGSGELQHNGRHQSSETPSDGSVDTTVRHLTDLLATQHFYRIPVSAVYILIPAAQ